MEVDSPWPPGAAMPVDAPCGRQPHALGPIGPQRATPPVASWPPSVAAISPQPKELDIHAAGLPWGCSVPPSRAPNPLGAPGQPSASVFLNAAVQPQSSETATALDDSNGLDHIFLNLRKEQRKTRVQHVRWSAVRRMLTRPLQAPTLINIFLQGLHKQ